MVEFEYDESQGFNGNFRRWFNLNCEERMSYNEKPYEREKAKRVFLEFVRSRNKSTAQKKNE